MQLAEYARELVKTGQAGVNQICELLGMSKDTYYHSQDEKSSLETKYLLLKKKLEKIIQDNPAYGYPRIKKALQDNYKITVNHKLLLKLLKLWGLSLKRKIRKSKKTFIQKVLEYLQSRANLLRKAIINSCFQAIVSDLTMIYAKFGQAYLFVHMDIYGKMIYGWNLSQSPDNQSLIFSLKQTIRKLKKFKIKDLKNIIFHQDRGSVYTSAEYVSELLKDNAFISYSKKGEPGDNAVQEAFFSRLKEEWRDIFSEAENFEELKNLIIKAIKYYNEKRYHTSISMQTPMQFTKKQSQKQKNLSHQIKRNRFGKRV